MRKGQLSFNDIRKELKPLWEENGTHLDTRFNLEMGADKKDTLDGNKTEAMLISVLGETYEKHPKKEEIRKEIADRKWDIEYENEEGL